MAEKRIHSVDTTKGVAIAVMIVLHAAIYHYGGIDEIDITNPPPFIMVMGVMAFWGGLFAVISGLVNTYRYSLRSKGLEAWDGAPLRRKLFLTGLGIYLFHLVYSAIAAPTALDFVGLDHRYGLVANLFRNGTLSIDPERLAQGTSVQMIGVNLMGLSALLPYLQRRKAPELASLGLAAVFLSTGLVRIALAPVYLGLVEGGRFLAATLLSPFAAEPYPVLPYFAFGLTGAAMGFRLARSGRLSRAYAAIGTALAIAGLTGVILFPTNLQEAGPFWFAKVLLELGVFTLIIWAVVRVAGFGNDRRHIFQQTAHVSLSVYALSTPLAEALAAALTPTLPGWNATISGTMVFALGNAVLWLGLVAAWRRGGFAWSLERLWVRMSPGSTKLQGWTPRQRPT